MLLAIDVGNSDTVVGLFDGENLFDNWRLHTRSEQTGDELYLVYSSLLRSVGRGEDDVNGIAVSTVVPELGRGYRRLGQRMTGKEALLIDHRSVPFLEIEIQEPSTVGADRLVNTVAAAELYGSPSLVVDLGTATTVDVVGPKGEYRGGLIAPGILSSASALFRQGARLSQVEVVAPERVVGRNTEESVQSGIFYNAVGGVDAMVLAALADQEFSEDTPVVATGGLAALVSPASATITHVDPTLTLTGIRMIWDRQRD